MHNTNHQINQYFVIYVWLVAWQAKTAGRLWFHIVWMQSHEWTQSLQSINYPSVPSFKPFCPSCLLSLRASTPLRAFSVTRQHIDISSTSLQELSPGLNHQFSRHVRAAAGPNLSKSSHLIAMLCRKRPSFSPVKWIKTESCSPLVRRDALQWVGILLLKYDRRIDDQR